MKSLSLKLKLKLSLIAALALSLLMSVAALIGGGVANADRAIMVNGITNTNILNVIDNAKLWAHKDGSEYYLMPVLTSDTDSVNFRKNLAYEWYYNSEEEVSADVPSELTKAQGYFNMEIGFENLDFEKYIIAFESQQFAQTKDAKTTNYLFFVPSAAESGKVEVRIGVKDAADKEIDDTFARADSLNVLFPADHIKISFSKDDNTEEGCYDVTLAAEGVNDKGVFRNIGGTYSKYSSSTTNPVTPISFKAQFAEDAENASARMAIYSINNQLFRIGTFTSVSITSGDNISDYYVKGDYRYEKVAADAEYDSEEKYYSYNAGVTENDEDGDVYYTLGNGSTINDDTPPVICLDSGLTFITEGEELGFDYTVIDVLQTPTVSTYYFMLKTEQIGEINPDDLSTDNLYREVKASEDQKMIVHVEHYRPDDTNYTSSSVFGENFTPRGAIKIYLSITDSYSGRAYLLLDWYIDDKYLLDIDGHKYIAVGNDEQGVAYGYTDGKVSNPETDEWKETVENYQTAVDEAVADQKLKAGTKNYFYLPSVNDLLSDNITDYNDLKFSIYYKTDSDSGTTGQTVTGKAASELSINITKAGTYVFTVYAVDASGNNMYYYTVDKNGDPELKEFAASEIWNMRAAEDGTDYEGLSHYIPWFYFTVSNTELTIEDPGEQKTAYVGTEYAASSFDVNGVDFKLQHTLYRFDSEKYFNDTNVSMTYEKFMAEKEQLFEEYEKTQNGWFIKIYALADMNETDGEYEIYADYKWDAENLRFVPQDANSFYLIECVSTNTDNGRQTAKSYMGISASKRVRALKGEDTWLKDNMTSIILLCIAGLSLIGIILLLVIKPKEQGDIDEVLETGSAKAKKQKKSK